jgi:hypothetical protein
MPNRRLLPPYDPNLQISPIPRPERFLMALASRTAPSIVLTPHQCLTDHLVLVGANEMPQEPFGGLLVNERGEAGAFCASPSVQLDHMMAVINASLKRWRVTHCFPCNELNDLEGFVMSPGQDIPVAAENVIIILVVSASKIKRRFARRIGHQKNG